MSYSKDRRIEDMKSQLIKNVLGQHFISKIEQADLEEAQDFGIYHVKPFNVGVRLRRFEHFKRFSREFTIRWSRPSGVKTEIDKIREGLVDFILYGFLDEKEQDIIQYFIGDLNIFRKVNPEPYRIYPNNPHDSDLAVFKFSQFPQEFFVAWWRNPKYVDGWLIGELSKPKKKRNRDILDKVRQGFMFTEYQFIKADDVELKGEYAILKNVVELGLSRGTRISYVDSQEKLALRVKDLCFHATLIKNLPPTKDIKD